MAQFDFVQTNFTRGELSPRLRGRIDFEGFFNGVQELRNFIALPLGGVMKRPGTRFVAEVQNSASFSRLIPFEFSVNQSYALEFGNKTLRFFADGGQLVPNTVSAFFDNPDFFFGLDDWTDASSGSGAVAGYIGPGFLADTDNFAAKLTPKGSGNEAILRQDVSITETNTIHSLRVSTDILNGPKTQSLTLRVGNFAGSNNIKERVLSAGEHVIDIDPEGNGTLYFDLVAEFDQAVKGEALVYFVDFQSGQALELETPYRSPDTNFLNWTQSADVLFLGHPNFRPRELRRFGTAEFSLIPYDYRDGPYMDVNLTDTTLTPSAVSGRVTLDASSTLGINGGRGFLSPQDLGRPVRIKITESKSAKFDGDGTKVKFEFGFFVPESDKLRVTLTNTGGSTIQNIAEGSTVDAFEDTDYTVDLNNPNAGGTVDFSVSKAPATDIEVTVIRDIVFWGWAEIVQVNSTTQVEALIRSDSGLGGASATKDWRLGAWSGTMGFPQVATFHNERLTWGASSGAPQTLWFSKSTDFTNFSPSKVDGTVNPDDSINITLATSQVNFIRWLSSINSGLAVGTSGAEFLVKSAATTEPLSPNSIEATRQTNRGSAAFVPVERVGLSTIFVQRGNETARELAFDFNVDGLVARDFSLVSQHLLQPGIARMNYQQNPDSILWMVRGDAQLLGFTLESDQEVFAWHRHTIGGSFQGADASVETTTITTEGGKDRLWMIVKRTINGVTRRYVEFLTLPWLNSDSPIEDAFFVDSGLTGNFAGSGSDTVSGLDHLEGETVKILADGATHPDRVVQNGEITLVRKANTVHVGLGYEARVQTFPLEEGVRGDTTRGKVKRISEAHLLFHETVGALFGREKLDRMPFRDSSMQMNQPVPPFTGIKSFRMPMRHNMQAFVTVVSDQPLPATLLGITAEMEFNDT